MHIPHRAGSVEFRKPETCRRKTASRPAGIVDAQQKNGTPCAFGRRGVVKATTDLLENGVEALCRPG
jgi:hypothetical protein